jgi:hypothetical protein
MMGFAHRYNPMAGSQTGIIIQNNGSAWIPNQNDSGAEYNFLGLWGHGKDIFAVGMNGTILHYQEPDTLISLATFTAVPKINKVILQWLTVSEIDNAGFNIYRSTSKNGEYVKINDTLIPAEGSPTSDASYEFVDRDVKGRKTYYYKLEDMDLNGNTTMHGTVSVAPRLILGLL